MSFPSIIAQHWGTLFSVRGQSATLSRGAATTSITIMFGRADSEALTNREVRTEADTQEIFAKCADYKIASTVVTPVVGDRIATTVNGITTTFELRPASVSEQHASHTDETRQYWRLQTKRV